MQRKRSRDVWLRNKGSKNGVFILIVHWSDGLENKWALIASEEFCESNAYRLPPLRGEDKTRCMLVFPTLSYLSLFYKEIKKKREREKPRTNIVSFSE